MKKILYLVISLVVLSTVISPNLTASDGNSSKRKEQVWQREIQYWELLQEINLEDYMKLWHPNFRGWPSYASKPGDKKFIRKSTEAILQTIKPGTVVFELEKKEINALGKTVSVFYIFTYSFTKINGDVVNASGRIFHTWMKYNDNWVIINGMSGPK